MDLVRLGALVTAYQAYLDTSLATGPKPEQGHESGRATGGTT